MTPLHAGDFGYRLDHAMNTYMNMLGGYRDRVARIALFDVFHHLENKQLKDDKDRPMDTFGIGLLSVLFFFENMLMRRRNTGIRELAEFLETMIGRGYDLSGDGYYTLAKQVVETFRPASGKGLKRSFYNYETGQNEEVDYAILRADDWDPEQGIQYYTLAEQGLELVFATKEYFSEFQISISQLMLRKQLEKGEFSGALRQVDEMRINVHTIRDKMQKIKHEIQRNIISDDTYTRYKEIIDDINRRLQQEHDEFQELVTFIRETKGHLDQQGSHSQKDLEALELIVRVDNELAHVHYLHASLLKESIELKTTAVEAAGESLYYAGVTSFNFDQEVARKLTTAPLPFESGKTLAAPFMSLARFSTWSPLAVFEPQVLDRPDRLVKADFLELEGGDGPQELKIRQQVNRLLVAEMMKVIGERKQFDLKAFLTKTDNPIFGTREFCDLWVVLHQLSPLSVKEVVSMEDNIFTKAFEEAFMAYDTVSVMELEEEISVQGNYHMKNMVFILGGEGQ